MAWRGLSAQGFHTVPKDGLQGSVPGWESVWTTGNRREVSIPPSCHPLRSACTWMGSPSPVHGSVLSPSPINGQSLPLQPLVTSDGHFSLYGFSYSGL